MPMRKLFVILVATLATANLSCADAQSLKSMAPQGAPKKQQAVEIPGPGDCGGLHNSVGPFDYRKHRSPQSPILENVEHNHFTEQVETLVKGQSSYLGADINYVLRAFPNHHRALLSLAKLGARDKVERVQGLGWPISCWFVRAIQFTPDDGRVHAIYAVHLARLGKSKEAVKEIDTALKLGENDPNTLYNAGLLHFDVKDYDKAQEYARKAYDAGFNLPGLKDKLRAVGKPID